MGGNVMERLTKKIGDRIVFPTELVGVTLHPANKTMFRLISRLAAYEDTGLEPEEIEGVQKEIGTVLALEHEFRNHGNMWSFDHFLELVQAEKDGRLVVLPCKVGNTVFVIGKRRVVECCIDEAYLDDTKGVEYLVSFDCNDDCNGCPFNSWHQDVSGEYSCYGEYEEASIMGADFGKTVFLTHEEAEAALKGENNDITKGS